MKATIIETAWGGEEGYIEIERSEEFVKAAQELGDFMNSLHLPANQHNRLVDLTSAQVLAAELGAFHQGIGLGLEYGRYEAKHQQKDAETVKRKR